MPETRLSRSHRRTVSTFSVSGPATIDYTTGVFPAEAVRPVQVLFRRLVPADDGDG